MASAKKETASLNIHQRLLQVMGEVDYIVKEKKQGMQYSIVSHDAVTAAVRPHLVDAGVTYCPVSLSYVQQGNRTECHMITRFTNADEPTDFVDVHSLGFGVDGQDKGPGKAQSYAMKYALLKALGLETGEDADRDQGKEADFIPECVKRVETFTKDLELAASEDDLVASFQRYASDIEEATPTHPGVVAGAKAAYAKKLRAVRAQAKADAADPSNSQAPADEKEPATA